MQGPQASPRPASAAHGLTVRRRAGLALLLALLLAGPALAAAQSPAGADDARARRAAVAPVQTVFDAAALLVERAMAEGIRDGTPDAARRLLVDVQAFVAAFQENLQVSEDATYRNLTLEAAPHAIGLVSVLPDVPDDIARLATSAELCAGRTLESEELRELEAARLAMNATAADLVARADAAPADVDATKLREAAVRLRSWSTTFTGFLKCDALPEEGDPTPVLEFTLMPGVAWPTGEVRVRGLTNLADSVRLSAPALGLDATLPVASGRFTHSFTIPMETGPGPHEVAVAAEESSANRTLEVVLAPSELAVVGPDRVAPGTDATFFITLRSLIGGVTDGATLEISGGLGDHTVTLSEGRVLVLLRAPEEVGEILLRVVYPGGHAVAGDVVELNIDVVPTESLSPSLNGDLHPLERLLQSVGAFVAARLWLLSLPLLAYIVWRLRGLAGTRRGLRAAGRSTAEAAGREWNSTSSAVPEPARLTLVPLFGLLARALRRLGIARPSTTAREMEPLLQRFGVEAHGMVHDFERVRYGAGSEEAGLTARAREWFRDAWDRLTGVRA